MFIVMQKYVIKCRWNQIHFIFNIMIGKIKLKGLNQTQIVAKFQLTIRHIDKMQHIIHFYFLPLHSCSLCMNQFLQTIISTKLENTLKLKYK